MEIFNDCSCKMGDYIGTESCVDLGIEIGNDEKIGDGVGVGGDVTRQISSELKRKEKTKKNYPPPIPLLARTENLAAHMPWNLRRYYTDDGRLIIEREKVRHHEYFQAYRSGGRLTLWLVPLDDVVYPNQPPSPEADAVTDEKDGQDEVKDDPTVENDDDDDGKLVISGSPAGGACCNFSRDFETTSFYKVPSVRPVYI
ncbi:uncharacterized protein LOC124927985 [Impatiens glandulifera]|uniref:uncharacterized protein LOC124927985 n=1 Tax=Impatiens glandulifera TaxID=253017 RepID=UPI001FB0574A|nr:uncharacterized protein LOC124927985 [Impatiens glandulifera]